jgi:hypothetical protein
VNISTQVSFFQIVLLIYVYVCMYLDWDLIVIQSYSLSLCQFFCIYCLLNVESARETNVSGSHSVFLFRTSSEVRLMMIWIIIAYISLICLRMN